MRREVATPLLNADPESVRYGDTNRFPERFTNRDPIRTVRQRHRSPEC